MIQKLKWRIWILGHKWEPMLGAYCRVCHRETTAHKKSCPIWILKPKPISPQKDKPQNDENENYFIERYLDS